MTTLNSNQTRQLWQRGKKAWNAAMQLGDITAVTFSGKLDSDKCQFKDCYFPTKAYFKDVTFTGVSPEKTISFENADFQEIQFSNISCIGVSISFKNAIFNALADFSHTTWRDISFENAEFKGITKFTKAKFQGLADFSEVKFSDDAVFVNAEFGKQSYFLYTKFNGNAYFNNILASEAEQFSFKGASFDNIFVISSEKEISCVMDFMNTHAKYSLNLENIYSRFRREHINLPNHKWLSKISKFLLPGFQVPRYPEDIERLRKLNRVAQKEKDHLRALDYRVQEIQAKRWYDNVEEPTGYLSKLIKAIPEFVFWILSDYGRSPFLPALWLLITFFTIPVYYTLLSANATTDQPQKQESCSSEQIDYYDALGYSFSQIFPNAPIAQAQQESIQRKINCSASKAFITFLSVAHFLFSALLLCLLKLGVRNRFLL